MKQETIIFQTCFVLNLRPVDPSPFEMKAQHKACLEEAREFLIENLQDIVDFILTYLFEEKIMEHDRFERLRTITSNRDKVAEMLNVLPKEGPNAFQVFRRAIEENQKKHVVAYLDTITKRLDSNMNHRVLGKLPFCFIQILFGQCLQNEQNL